MFFELREYRILSGQMKNWVKFMEEEIIPFQVSKGMVVVGSFTGKDEDNLYIWIRRFDNEEERIRLYKAVYESEYWETEIDPKISTMMDRSKKIVRNIQSTPQSVIR